MTFVIYQLDILWHSKKKATSIKRSLHKYFI